MLVVCCVCVLVSREVFRSYLKDETVSKQMWSICLIGVCFRSCKAVLRIPIKIGYIKIIQKILNSQEFDFLKSDFLMFLIYLMYKTL